MVAGSVRAGGSVAVAPPFPSALRSRRRARSGEALADLCQSDGAGDTQRDEERDVHRRDPALTRDDVADLDDPFRRMVASRVRPGDLPRASGSRRRDRSAIRRQRRSPSRSNSLPSTCIAGRRCATNRAAARRPPLERSRCHRARGRCPGSGSRRMSHRRGGHHLAPRPRRAQHRRRRASASSSTSNTHVNASHSSADTPGYNATATSTAAVSHTPRPPRLRCTPGDPPH